MSFDAGPTTLDEYRLALDNANERTRAALAERDAADAHRLTFREEAERVLAEHRSRAEAAEKDRDEARELITFGRHVSPSLLDSVSDRDARILSAWAAVRAREAEQAKLARNAAESERDAARKERDQIEAAARSQSYSGHEWNRLLNERDAALAREADLRAAIKKHRHDVWGKGHVQHDADVTLYAALSQETR